MGGVPKKGGACESMRLSPCVLVQPDGWARGEREGYGEPCDVTSLSQIHKKESTNTHYTPPPHWPLIFLLFEAEASYVAGSPVPLPLPPGPPVRLD